MCVEYYSAILRTQLYLESNSRVYSEPETREVYSALLVDKAQIQ